MTVVSDAAVSSGDLMRRVADLERQVRELRAARRLEAATIGAGGLTITDGGNLVVDGGALDVVNDGRLRSSHTTGVRALDVGAFTLAGAGTPVHGVLIRRPNGALAFWAYGHDGGGDSFWALYDKAGAIVVSDDSATGQGLATPYIAGGVFQPMGPPTDVNNATSFVALQKAIWRKQHPRVRLWALHNVTSTTAEIQWRVSSGPDDGTVIGGPIAVGAGFGYAGYGPFDLPGSHLSEFEIDVEARVASGAGQVGVRMLHAMGVQSP